MLQIYKDKKVCKSNPLLDAAESEIITPFSYNYERDIVLLNSMYSACVEKNNAIPTLSSIMDLVNDYNWNVINKIAIKEYSLNHIDYDLHKDLEGISENAIVKDEEYISARTNDIWARIYNDWDLCHVPEYVTEVLADLKHFLQIDTDLFNIAYYLKNPSEFVYLNDCQGVLFKEMHTDGLGPLIDEISDGNIVSGMTYRKI